MTQDALARLLELAEKGKHEHDIGWVMSSAKMQLDYEVVAALVRDAMRYRWLQPRFRAFSVHIDGMHSWCATGDIGRIKGPSFDAAIDAALAKVGE